MISVFVCSETPSQSYFWVCCKEGIWLYYYLFILSKQHLLPEIFLCHWKRPLQAHPAHLTSACPGRRTCSLPLLLALAVPQSSSISFLPDSASQPLCMWLPLSARLERFPAAPPNIWLTFTLPWGLSWGITLLSSTMKDLTALTTVYNKRIEAHLGP